MPFLKTVDAPLSVENSKGLHIVVKEVTVQFPHTSVLGTTAFRTYRVEVGRPHTVIQQY